ncbi:haloacid dehalogenase, partial [Streptococcus thermophilus]|nr:haloacid dehalogenase [Streptococcus thermophilus]
VRNKQQQIEIVQPISAHDFLLIKKIITDQDLDYLIDSDWNYALLNRNEERAQINDKVDQCHLAKNVSLSEIDRAIKCNLLNPQSETILHELKKLNLEIIRHEATKSID